MTAWLRAFFSYRALTVCLLGSLLLLAACAQEPWTPGKPLSKDKVRIGVLYIDKAENCGYSFAHEQGLRAMQETIGLRDDQILRKFDVSGSDSMMVEHVIRNCISAGANVIIATSFGYMDVCDKLAREFPGVVFAHASGYKWNNTNFTNYFGRIYQARYLGGIVAGLKTRSNKIGFVAAMGLDNSEVTGGVNAFALGVESVNPGARIFVRVTNNWYDPASERQAARNLLLQGCDVIAQHCDTANPQLEAERAGVWSVGYNSDMSAQAPNAVLTSVIWNWQIYYTRLVESVLSGNFRTAPYYGGMAEGLVDISPLSALCPPETEAAVNAAREALRQGAFSVFVGPMRANNGNIHGATGERLSDEEIIGGMNWYYHTVSDISTE